MAQLPMRLPAGINPKTRKLTIDSQASELLHWICFTQRPFIAATVMAMPGRLHNGDEIAQNWP
jgi:hypothetical protein